MISFLRKIRKSLINSGSAKKYLFYAFGEILLVVFGILIALQINNWNENRKERILEKEVLHEVLGTIEANISNLEDMITGYDYYNPSGLLVYEFLNTGDMNLEINPGDWQRALMNRANIRLQSAGYESLKNNGFSIIKNSTLKNEILKLFEEANADLERKMEWGNTVRPDLDPFTLEHFAKNKDSEGKISFGLLPRDKESLLTNYYYIGLIETAIGQRGFYKNAYSVLKEESKKVRDLIKEELKIEK